MELYPTITRPNYLKGYRYNLHLREKSLLIELGNQNNSSQEALNALEPMAEILDAVLPGKQMRKDSVIKSESREENEKDTNDKKG